MKGEMTKYHVGIILTGALLCFGPATMVLNSWSIFMVPVSTTLGVSTDVFSLQPSILYLVSAAFATPVGWLIKRFDLRAVLTSACLAGGISIALSGACTHIWQLFVLAVPEGYAGLVLMFLMLPNLTSRWFEQRMGTVVGLCMAMSGFGGALWAFLGGQILVAAGWRVTYVALGVIALVISLPACMFLMRNHPEDLGLVPYGHTETLEKETQTSEAGVPVSVGVRSATFVLFVVAIGLVDGGICLANLLPTFVYHLNDVGTLNMTAEQVIIAASTVALCTQAAQACFKIVFGLVADLSSHLAFLLTVVSAIVAVHCFMMGASVFGIICLGAVLFGSLFALLDVVSPVLMRSFFGNRNYSMIYSRFGTFVNIVPAFSVFVFAKLSNYSWDLTFVVTALCFATTLLCGILAIATSRRLRCHFHDEDE